MNNEKIEYWKNYFKENHIVDIRKFLLDHSDIVNKILQDITKEEENVK